MQQTTLWAYDELSEKQKRTLKKRILKLLEDGDYTANEISVNLDVKISSITGRLHELAAEGKIKKGFIRSDRFSGYRAYAWVLV